MSGIQFIHLQGQTVNVTVSSKKVGILFPVKKLQAGTISECFDLVLLIVENKKKNKQHPLVRTFIFKSFSLKNRKVVY